MVLTYELQKDGNAKEYYQLTQKLAKQLQEQMIILDKPIRLFRKYIQDMEIEPVREDVEYGIELLDFAILHRWIQNLSESKRADSYEKLKESVGFMQRSGEFKEEVRRFQSWLDFFAGYEETEWRQLWRDVWRLVEMVDELGNRHLQRYLPQLQNYLETNRCAWNSREDAGLILRDKNCYYINMIAAQMLNECCRQDFVACDKTYIFLPGCMSSKGKYCQARESEDGYVCVSCSEECQVNRLSKLYPGVRIVYHGSQMEKKKVSTHEKIGVVGVACVLNLISGGWKAKRLGYVPQCVILNECGCNIHWDEKGLVTSLDEEELGSLF